jgi:hypothetical protein
MTRVSVSVIACLKKSALKEDCFVVQESIFRSVSESTENDYRFREIPLTSRVSDKIIEAAVISESEYVYFMRNGKNFHNRCFSENMDAILLQCRGNIQEALYNSTHICSMVIKPSNKIGKPHGAWVKADDL